jgi:coenzyme PQQ precursor peptide PqqA
VQFHDAADSADRTAGRVWGRTFKRSVDMKWETPQAVELRFGMEITMYVSNR